MVSARDGKKNGVSEKVLSTLLNEMDGFGSGNTPLSSTEGSTCIDDQRMKENVINEPVSGGGGDKPTAVSVT